MDYRVTFTDRSAITACNVTAMEARAMAEPMGTVDTITPNPREITAPTSGPLSMADARAHADAFYRRNADEYIARTR